MVVNFILIRIEKKVSFFYRIFFEDISVNLSFMHNIEMNLIFQIFDFLATYTLYIRYWLLHCVLVMKFILSYMNWWKTFQSIEW